MEATFYRARPGRRGFLALLACCCVPAFAEGDVTLRGTLTKTADGKPTLRLASGETVLLTGDEETTGVLHDARLANADFEVTGKRSGGALEINPIHTAALFVHKNGKRLRVTYWCDVCAIRTYTPGLCWCCREDTELDLQDPAATGKK